MDLEQKTDDELKHLIAEAQGILKVRDEKRRKDIEKQIRELAQSAGLSVEIKRHEKAKDSRYRNPANPSQTWNGIGKRPQWIKDALAAGKALEDMAG